MVDLTVGHLWSMVQGAPENELDAVIDALTVSNCHYWQQLKRGVRNPARNISLIREGHIFPTGLVPRLTKELAKKNIEVRIVKSSLDPVPLAREPRADMFQGFTFREEQMKLLPQMLSQPRGYLDAFPGFGKTEVIFALYECFRPALGLFIVTRSGLRAEAFKRFVARMGHKPFVLGDDTTNLPTEGLVITTWHTLYNRLFGRVYKKRPERNKPPSPQMAKWIEGVKIILCDEIKRASGGRYLKCLQKIPADRRYGFSATALTKDPARNMELRGWIGERLYKVNVVKAMARGELAKPHVFIRDIGRDDPIEFQAMLGYQHAFRVGYNNYAPFWKEVIIAARWFYANNLPCLILVDWEEPGERIYNLLLKAMPDPSKVAYINGKMDVNRQRLPIMDAFKREEIMTLVATPVLGEGENIPNISAVIIATAGRDKGNLYQKIGRGTRPKDGRPNVVYIVFFINRRHEYFIGQSKELLKYFMGNKKLYTFHGPNEPYTLVTE